MSLFWASTESGGAKVPEAAASKRQSSSVEVAEHFLVGVGEFDASCSSKHVRWGSCLESEKATEEFVNQVGASAVGLLQLCEAQHCRPAECSAEPRRMFSR